MTQPNPFIEIFEAAPQMVHEIIVGDEDDGTVFSDALEAMFNQEMANLAEQMPDNDEDQANQLMAEAVQAMMITCFKAGMVYQHEIAPPGENADNIPIVITPDQAGALISGMMTDGASFSLIVDRGQH